MDFSSDKVRLYEEVRKAQPHSQGLSGAGEKVQIAKGIGVRWYRHVLRRGDGHVLRKALEFEVRGRRKPGRPRKTWKMQVEKWNSHT